MKLLELLNKLSYVGLVLLLLLIANLLSSINKQKFDFYEYNGEKINLKMVKHVVPRVEYVITYKEDKSEDIFRHYSTALNPKEIENIEGFLNLAMKSAFYNVEIRSFMMFDAQKIELYHSARYLKKAEEFIVDTSFLETMKQRGLDDFQYKNLLKMQDKVYHDKKSFIEDVLDYAKLKNSEWMREAIVELARDEKANIFMKNIKEVQQEKELDRDTIESIKEKLEASYSQYLGIK